MTFSDQQQNSDRETNEKDPLLDKLAQRALKKQGAMLKEMQQRQANYFSA